MAGTGTTGVVAKALSRDFVMIERNPIYVDGIVRRFEQPLNLSSDAGPDREKVERYLS